VVHAATVVGHFVHGNRANAATAENTRHVVELESLLAEAPPPPTTPPTDTGLRRRQQSLSARVRALD
jgi:hypothetical protein